MLLITVIKLNRAYIKYTVFNKFYLRTWLKSFWMSSKLRRMLMISKCTVAPLFQSWLLISFNVFKQCILQTDDRHRCPLGPLGKFKWKKQPGARPEEMEKYWREFYAKQQTNTSFHVIIRVPGTLKKQCPLYTYLRLSAQAFHVLSMFSLYSSI